MLIIRLARVGKTKKPYYRVVISDQRKDMYGDYLELLGNYNPHNKALALKAERIKYWLSKGAQTSPTIHNLLVKEGLLTAKKKAKAVTISVKRQAKLQKAKELKTPKPEVAKPAEGPAETAVEQPVQTASTENDETKAEEQV